jgi:hypothetical protein
MPKVLNKKHDLIPLGNSVYIGRPSPWGNPFVIGQDGTREEVIEKFRVYLLSRPDLMEQVKTELRGKDLVCFCAPEPCHGDILLYFANFEEY